MDNKEINIKSTTIEKGLELAKTFVEKLIVPTAEEVGLLVAENVKYFRFKNQIKILLKAKKYVETQNISPKEIPLKILVPLLEKASLEENEELQDKWAKMITNLSDSETNLQNQIFPYLLSQLSIEEFNSLKNLHEKEKAFRKKKNDYYTQNIEEKKAYQLKEKDRKLKKEIEKIEQEGFLVSNDFTYELSNIERLGLMKKTLPNVIVKPPLYRKKTFFKIDLNEYKTKYDPTKLNTYRITELGVSFIRICEIEKDKACG